MGNKNLDLTLMLRNSPLFGLFGVPDEDGNYLSDYLGDKEPCQWCRRNNYKKPLFYDNAGPFCEESCRDNYVNELSKEEIIKINLFKPLNS